MEIEQVEGSPQTVEPAEVIHVFFSKFAFHFNLVTNSFYVARVVESAKGALLKTVSNNKLYDLLKK